VQNIVASSDVRFPIRLEGLAYSHGLFSSYEPEIFPGLIYRMKEPKLVLLIFVSGKVVLTGAKHRADIYRAFELMFPVLQEFRKGDAAAAFGAEPAAPAAAPPALMAAGGSRVPQTPLHGGNLPPPTPMHGGNLPPPTPRHGLNLPPPTPAFGL